MCQWDRPTKGDWTEMLRKDLSDFQIESDFQWIRQTSREGFKKIVNSKAKVFGLKYLTNLQKKHSKLSNLTYNELKLQNYLTMPGLSLEVRRNVFLFRTRMLDFGENFRGSRSEVLCPFGCYLKKDSQFHSFECNGRMQKLNVDGEYKDLFKVKIAQFQPRFVTH